MAKARKRRKKTSSSKGLTTDLSKAISAIKRAKTQIKKRN